MILFVDAKLTLLTTVEFFKIIGAGVEATASAVCGAVDSIGSVFTISVLMNSVLEVYCVWFAVDAGVATAAAATATLSLTGAGVAGCV